MKVFELREKSREELTDLLNGFYKEIFNLRLRRGAQELPNPLRLRTLRRDVARIKTVLREDELDIKKLLEPKKSKHKPKKGK
ncbi:50S ribosomal protein L29 [candidate division WOR-3 bacterium]|jgi:large subunit ribosomal protein L29|nr:50S ribosomal protein L29 [candidate division WOR-3 bacterium]